MSEKEKRILEKVGDVTPTLSEEKKEYLLGVMDGIALMNTQKKEGTNNDKDNT